MSLNAANRKSVREAEKAAKVLEQERAQTTAQIMSTTQGRQWIWTKLSECHVFNTTHVPGDALGSAFREGERNSGLRLLSDLMSHCPDLYILAMREAHVRYISDDRSTSGNASPGTDSDAERRSGPLGDGGDSGAEPDQTSDDERSPSTSPGADIYAS